LKYTIVGENAYIKAKTLPGTASLKVKTALPMFTGISLSYIHPMVKNITVQEM
jgi:hypothetical protein